VAAGAGYGVGDAVGYGWNAMEAVVLKKRQQTSNDCVDCPIHAWHGCGVLHTLQVR
jgi:hypothetical protein